MKLHKKTRTRLHAASPKREAIWAMWPKSAPPAVMGQKYRVSHFPEGARLLVLGRLRLKSGRFKCLLQLDHDPTRVVFGLHGARNQEGEYEPEPERVSKRYEEQLAQEGAMKTRWAGAQHRERARVLASEQRLLDARKGNEEGTVRYLERVQKHRSEKAA